MKIGIKEKIELLNLHSRELSKEKMSAFVEKNQEAETAYHLKYL
jgi:hypothetical protein